MIRKTIPMKELAEVVKLQLENGGKANLTVTGNSMWPMMLSGRDSVILIPPGNEKKGDVVLYQRASGQYVLHRIIDVTRDGYIFCGDNQVMRELVAKEQFIAVMESFTRNGKHYSRNTFSYRIYQTVWVELFFLRPFYFKVRGVFSRMRRRIGKLIHNR